MTAPRTDDLPEGGDPQMKRFLYATGATTAVGLLMAVLAAPVKW